MSSYAYTEEALASQGKRSALIPATRPYHSLSKCLIFANLDQDRWWHQTAPILGEMLFRAEYDVHQQYQYLCQFGMHLIPMLGPFPDHRQPELCSTLIGGAGNLELSQNFTRKGATIRVGLEPRCYRSVYNGTTRFQYSTASNALETLKHLGKNIDLELYHTLTPKLTLTDSDQALLPASSPALRSPISAQLMLAIDLKDGDFGVKLYLVPPLKAAVLGITPAELLFTELAKWDTRGAFHAPLTVLQDFLTTAPDPPTVLTFGCDLVRPEATRLKIYVQEQNVTFENVRRVWTLGGRLDNEETLTGLAMVRELWEALGVPEGIRSSTRPPVLGDPPFESAILFNFELNPLDPLPAPKIYIPLMGLGDMVIADALVEFFRRRGWAGHAETYVDNLASYIPGLDVYKTTDLQGILTFSYSERTGPYLTMYYR
ncbi:cyclo-L-Trp-L-Trp prenyltransferase [Aspergillus campestris IBT 28561]|uniref:Cyclo-L-Trp-L-Trp prenyltransferase n=1 Tax=Aspergillus campestris (strain IBT 28561) TaxID=1392248 RepID=A0A2I1CU06_ASPC2|nr:cyclo-L-Trp-L-Trp prenyltransferase [Aspergillus campestris IBT 28561]PKY01110.1 cyclo-L-Trp-L-Trp prenyltransferase [Aspergillus campestris IBT 28561]